MRRLGAAGRLVALVLVAACEAGTSPGAPDLIGTIAAREGPRILVYDSTALSREPCARGMWFGIGAGTLVIDHRGAPADTGTLTVGRRVSAWSSGIVLESCPPQTGATLLRLEQAE